MEKALLLIGGCGSLGGSIITCFLKKNWIVLVIDHKQKETPGISYLNINDDTYSNPSKLNDEIKEFLLKNKLKGFNAIINAAGGFEYSDIKNDSFMLKAKTLFEKNYMSSILCSYLSCYYLLTDSVIIFTGSGKVFKEISPELLLYQTSKTSTHSIAMTLKDSSELPDNTCIIAILPDIFDTPKNRQSMPLEDFSKWTSTDLTADLLLMWCNGFNKPKTGSFAMLKTKDDIVIPEFI
jgi:short-subunit dehydrogenase involved in D-alanine esterification of teichoic acids